MVVAEVRPGPVHERMAGRTVNAKVRDLVTPVVRNDLLDMVHLKLLAGREIVAVAKANLAVVTEVSQSLATPAAGLLWRGHRIAHPVDEVTTRLAVDACEVRAGLAKHDRHRPADMLAPAALGGGELGGHRFFVDKLHVRRMRRKAYRGNTDTAPASGIRPTASSNIPDSAAS